MQVTTHPLDARAAGVTSVPAPAVFNPRPDAAESEAIVGQSDGLRYVMSRVDLVAETDANVLLCGETGTGKGLVASAIHRASRRRDKPYVVVNCATLPASLIESELFGRERGAFTGAHITQAGRFELAHRGTVFLAVGRGPRRRRGARRRRDRIGKAGAEGGVRHAADSSTKPR